MHNAGFFVGLVHGIFVVPLFVMSFFGQHLFHHHWVVYNIHNTGHWYDFGFLLGIGAFAKSCDR